MGRNHSDPTRGDTRGATTAAGLTDDQLYRALAATDRRRVLYSLLTTGPASPDQLATLLAGWQATDSGRLVTAADRDRRLTELVHVHLPLLEDAGLVDRDEVADTVEIGALDPAVANIVRESVGAGSKSRG
ncbi:DUF7344 domain-containing protein [Haloarchaeobius baliensis]|uniref:DUF7344 domain-containing protein n=1 Tax=Haloarchaeobius baliensis TaxID=1670458 RepID=UPI003F885A09